MHLYLKDGQPEQKQDDHQYQECVIHCPFFPVHGTPCFTLQLIYKFLELLSADLIAREHIPACTGR